MLDTVPPMLQATAAIIFGFAGLIWSADRFVAGSAAIAKSFGISPLIIGLTIVSFGTSAPEVMVSLNASFNGSEALAIGNAIGSNIANMGLVLGVTTLIAAIPVQRHLLTQELPVLLLVTLITGIFIFDYQLSRWEGIALLLCVVPTVGFLVIAKQKSPGSQVAAEDSEIPNIGTGTAIFWFLLGLIALIACSDILVWGAKTTAELFGVSELIVGLTVIAVGTSLPELAASAVSALKGHHDIAVGNIIGSNMFNLLAVMSIPGVVNSLPLAAEVLWRDFAVMLLLTIVMCILVFVCLRRKSGTPQLGKAAGVLLLTVYIGYNVKLFFDN